MTVKIMFAKSPAPSHAAPGAELWRGAARRLAVVSLPEAGVLVWLLLLLVAMPVVVFSYLPLPQLAVHVEPESHALIEAFCGLTALTLAGMMLSACFRRRDPGLVLFGLGFLVMGVFDLLHASTDPRGQYGAFVLYHTSSTLFGSVFILAGAVVRTAAERRNGFSRADALTLGIGLALAVVVAVFYQYAIPELFGQRPPTMGFSAFNHAAHYLAALFYVLAAIAAYRYFREHHQKLALLAFSLLLVFAQSAYLFSLSNLWDLTWWMWHGVKLLFYLGTVLIVFVGFTVALRTIEQSRRSLFRVNRQLQRSQQAIVDFNHELEIRNRMAQQAMLTLTLDNALDVVSDAIHRMLGLTACELILHVPADEVDEFDSLTRRLSSRWPVRAMRKPSRCPDSGCEAVQPLANVFDCGNHGASGDRGVCLSLTSDGQEIGRLRLVAGPAGTARRRPGALRALGIEAGAIVHGALLNQRREDADHFREALLRVSSMITSTLELDRVLGAVCRESAALFECDGALVWLPDSQARSFFLAANWFAQTDQSVSAELEAWCDDGEQCAALLQGVRGQYRPMGILWQDASQATPFRKPEGCPWQALALFPLLDGEQLIGVMVLARTEPVRFSAATLGKGVLLAEQVRIAVNNARSYTQLAEFNQQLRLAEETKLRSERMAVMGQMAASVAHEVRNPLSAINNCLAVLRPEVAATPRSQAALEIIQDEVERLTSLTSNFLSFGKPRASVSTPVVLEQVVKKTCALIERHIAQEGLPIAVTLNVEPTSSLLLFDADALEAVLWNLLLNASQAIHGTGRIDVGLRRYAGHFLVAVTDSGKGIAAEDRARVFEPFYSQRPLGAGLGLAIVQRLVREWHGQIRVRSRVGEGTTFFLRVPGHVEETLAGRGAA